MKKILAVIILLSMLFVTGCNKNKNSFITVKADSEDNIVIDTTNVTNTATFVNYEADGITIQFIVVRGTDGVVRIALNTCQVCTHAENAYFIQKGEYLECQNCKTKFHINKLGVEQGGCNPTPVLEIKEENNKIIIAKDYADSFKDKFMNWNGKTK